MFFSSGIGYNYAEECGGRSFDFGISGV